MTGTPGDLVRAAHAVGVTNARLIEAVRSIPRAEIVPADEVASVPGHARSASPRAGATQPSLIAMMVSALGLTGDEHVLEVGTGYGCQTALLARLAAYVADVECLNRSWISSAPVVGSSSRSGRAGRSASSCTSGGPTTWCTAGRSPRPGSSGWLYGADGYDQR